MPSTLSLYLPMPSHLTRSIFRRLLSNQGLIFRCPTQSTLLLRRNRNVTFHIARPPQQRTLFGFARKPPPRQPQPPDLDPGYKTMVDLAYVTEVGARPPPNKDIIHAWRNFFAYKLRKEESVTNIQAKYVLRTFNHLLSTASSGGQQLHITDIMKARKSLIFNPDYGTETHQDLAKLFYAQSLKTPETIEGENVLNSRAKSCRWLVHVLVNSGASLEARNLVQEWVTKDPADAFAHKDDTLLWELILAGFARENNEEGLLETLDMALATGNQNRRSFHETMCRFYAARDNIERTKEWYSKHKTPTPATIEAILQFSIRNNELEWCKMVFKNLMDLMESRPNKLVWDLVLRWAAGVVGKGVEDVERMMDVMLQRNSTIRPDIETINGLVDLAMSRQDPYLAERYISLGLKFGIKPNARTYILQIDYRASANDLSGAQVAYEALQSQEVIKDEDLPSINKFIRALCSAQSVNYDKLKPILADLSGRNKRLEADTVSSLTKVYLERDEIDNATDLLELNSYHYTSEERIRIRDTIRAFCLDRNNHTVRVWHAYCVLRQIFDEDTIEIRTEIMNEFFFRRRCDMACHVFGHMRSHDLQFKRPVRDTYIQCFVGIAQCADQEHLNMVHNMMKMDSKIEPNTKLYNSLMLAYTACNDAYRAMKFWDDITNSYEGPTYKSLEIVFWACGKLAFGGGRAKEIWDKMRRMEIEVTREVFAAYVGAMAGQGEVEEARKMVEGGDKNFAIKPDVLILGTLYNSLHGQTKKDSLEKWSKEKYPDAWADLEKLGQTILDDGFGPKLFNMERQWEA